MWHFDMADNVILTWPTMRHLEPKTEVSNRRELKQFQVDPGNKIQLDKPGHS